MYPLTSKAIYGNLLRHEDYHDLFTMTEYLLEINNVEFCNVKRSPFQSSQEMNSIAFFSSFPETLRNVKR